ncbi:MAG: ABC transporter substrate-binding protein [Desulfuromonadaceae bacterium]|nr:ABC transporter substrate-binding protein [Desulfuromonadaceae bacterium]
MGSKARGFTCAVVMLGVLQLFAPAGADAQPQVTTQRAVEYSKDAVMSGPMFEIKQTIDRITEQLLAIGTTSTWRNNVSKLVHSKFNFEVMSQGVLGPNWHKATPQERERFIELFSQLLEETYIGRVREYTGQKIRFGNEQIRQNRAVVDTYIAMDSGDEIPISYKMLQNDDEWQVYDVVIEEVSLVRNYRSSYSSILRKKNVGGLLEEMQAKIKELKQRHAVEDRSA